MTSPDYQKHLLIVEDDKGQREFILQAPAYSLGRSKRCDIRVESLFVSNRHATLLRLPNKDSSYSYQIIDGDGKGKYSTNGLSINGEKIRARILKHNDKIVFGSNVQVTYLYMQRQDTSSAPLPDPSLDVTLIDPAMVEKTVEEQSPAKSQPTPGQI
ncbi:MAG TPA: phosphopeptide-binding protein [Cyanobacteria bacterium UBA11369]|nr:phosphopeptide-binding protein [Cyanobacteria bacterium UBA11371]HBE31399.1 phosphopeptide-binding protein [Cyanobacteria bacterium UBA11368]HBE50565.1 phosphopeptide-binding protein [Cyanobacteria bacterium UBA11369]